LIQFYELHRDEDISGISGSGHVADAVVFHNGKCVVSWRGPKASIVVYDSLEDAKAIHGHNGSTRFVQTSI
jgi:hypothetical protein